MKKDNFNIASNKSIFSNQKGMALLTTLIFTFVIGTLAVAVLSMTSNDTKLSALQRDSTKAFYLAEAGIQRSIKELKDDFEWDGIFNDENEEGFVELGDGRYTIDVIKNHTTDPAIPENQVRVTSTGRVRNSERNIEIFVKSGGIHPIFKYAIASKTDLVFSGNPSVTGDIYAGGDIEISGSVDIEGDVNAVGGVTTSGSSTVTGGDINEGVDEEIFPIIDTASYIDEAQVGGTHEGVYKITGSGAETLGPIYIDGDLDVGGSVDVTLVGTVYVTGEVKFNGSGSVDGTGTIICVNDMKITSSYNLAPENMPVFISTTGNIKVAGNAYMQLVAYAPEGKMSFSGKPTLYGALVSEEYKGVGNLDITHYQNLDDLDLNLPPGPFSIVSWQEIY